MQGGGSAKVKQRFGVEQTFVWRAAECVWCRLCKCHSDEFVDGSAGWLLRLVGSCAPFYAAKQYFQSHLPNKKMCRVDRLLKTH